MDSANGARVCFGATSAIVTGGLILQLVLAIRNDDGLFTSVPARIVNVLSFFTIQSNIIVAITTGLLAL
ncbi:MAG: F420-dependent oxidoreductase, partial [Actinobacteria bacterium]|nr:F420-dependent oxidoreductase [Actinomycetota bacterium]